MAYKHLNQNNDVFLISDLRGFRFIDKKIYNYKRKVLIKDLELKMLIGIHNFEKKKKQRVRFNLAININQNLFPNDNDLKSIVNFKNST